MESPKNREDKVPTRHLTPQNQTPSSRNALHLSFWPKYTHGNSQTTQSITKVIGYSPLSDDNILLLKTTFTEHGEAQRVPT